METNAQPQAIENAAPQAEQADKQPQTIKIKYNHEEKELPIDEAVLHIQKGMNYDKVYDKLQSYEKDEALKILDEMAQEYGIPKADLMKRWKTERAESKAKEYAEQHDIPQEVAKELLESKQKATFYETQYLTAEQKREHQEQIDNQIKEFRDAYPDVKDADVPDSVIELARGKKVPLKIAYEAHLASTLKERVSKMEQELKVKNVNDSNSASSMGSAASSGDTQPGDLTLDDYAKMSSEERRKILEKPNNPLFRLLQKRKE